MTRYGTPEYTTLASGHRVTAASTAMAIAVEVEGVLRWIPRSVVEDGADVIPGSDSGDLSVKSWFVAKEDLPVD